MLTQDSHSPVIPKLQVLPAAIYIDWLRPKEYTAGMTHDLYLYEEFMLLALREETGTLQTSETIEYSLAAAILSELLLARRIELDRENPKKQLVNLIDPQPFGDDLLDEALEKIKTANRRASLKTWVQRLAHLKKIRHRAAQQLCRRGILREDEGKILLIFTRKMYPEVNPMPERKVVDRLRKAIFSDAADVDPRDAVIIALAHHSHLLRTKFDKQDLRSRKKRIKDIAAGEATAKAVKEIMDAVQAAIMVAVLIPAMVAATSGN